jgi:hypothetical protein
MDVVFHCSSADVRDWAHAPANVRNLLDDDSVDVGRVELLANGDAVRLLTPETLGNDRLAALRADGVRLVACGNSLDSRGLEDAPLEGVERVPSGVGELVRRQGAGDASLEVP